MSKVKIVLLCILVVALIVFLFFTSHSVDVMKSGDNIWFQLPMWAVVMCSVVFGMILGVLLSAMKKKSGKTS